MSSPSTLLFVSYSFPPEAEVGGKRVARFSRYLPEFGIRPAVLTIDPKFYEACDTTYAVPAGTEVIRTGSLTHPLEWYRTLRSWIIRKGSSTFAHGGNLRREELSDANFIQTVRRSILLAVETPDRYWGWYWPAVRAGVRFVKDRRPEAIVSSGPPWTSHLVARGIHRKTGVRWIADFRDPWTLSPWRDALPSSILRFERRLERSIIEESDRIVCVADETAEDFRAYYNNLPASKFVVITNGFEGDVAYSEPQATQGKRSLLHLGSLYGDRRIRPLLRAYVNLVNDGRVDPNSMQFLFVGLIDADMIEDAKDEIAFLEKLGAIEFRPRVPYEEGQKLLTSCDVLLLLQGDNRSTIPAKLFEYLLTGKPILVTAKQGSLTRLVTRYDLGVCADSEDTHDIGEKLLACLRMQPRAPAQFERIANTFHFRVLAGRLVRVIRECS